MVEVQYLKETKTFSPQEISSMVLTKVCAPEKPKEMCLHLADEGGR
jgi:hypothetical protein